MFVYVEELMCIYKYTRTCIHMHMKAKRICYTSILPSTFFFKTGSITGLSYPQDAGLVDQWTSGICLTPPTQPWDAHSAFLFGFWALYLLSHPISHIFFFFFAKIKGPDMLPWQQVVIQHFRAMDEGCSWKSRLASWLCSSRAPFLDDWWSGLSEKNRLFLIFLVILSFPGMISSWHFVWAHTEGLYSRCLLRTFWSLSAASPLEYS